MCTVTYNDQRSLPQGSPHSMPLFNRALYDLDDLLDSKAKERGCAYTRWVDDLTVSSPYLASPEEFMGAVALVRETRPVARGKIFFQTSQNPIYLLGQVIEGGRVFKNSRQEREENKTPNLDYAEWFGGSRKYEKWE